MTQETVEDLERVKREMEELVRKKDGEINNLNGRLEDDASMIAKLQKTIKELQVSATIIIIYCVDEQRQAHLYLLMGKI